MPRAATIWQVTQAVIAVAVTLAALYVSIRLALQQQPEMAAFILLSNAFFFVLGVYFQRLRV